MRIRLGTPLTLREICYATSGVSHISDRCIYHISTDSRETFAGDLFITLTGSSSGIKYIPEAKDRGAVILSSDGRADIVVRDTQNSLLSLAAYYRRRKLPKLIETVAITGSVGKTTTKEILYKALDGAYITHKNEGNYNNAIGMSLTILSTPAETEFLILEMGMNHRGEISALSKCAAPTIAIITNIGTSHIGNLGSKEEIAAAKLELLDGLDGPLIVPHSEPLLKGYGTYTFSLSDPSADTFIQNVCTEKSFCSYEVFSGGLPMGISFSSNAPHIVECLAAAVTVLQFIGFDFTANKRLFSNISEYNMRQNISKIGDFFILSDYYNASFESFKSGFEYIKGLVKFPRKSAVIGDVMELGDFSKEIHFNIGFSAASYDFDKLYLFGKYAPSVASGATSAGYPPERIFINTDTDFPEKTATDIISNHTPGEIIFMKASHAVRLDRILPLLKK